MLNVKIGGPFKSRVKLTAMGSTELLAAETGYIIGAIFRSLRVKAPIHAEMYRKFVIELVNDPDAPTWEIEREGDE